MLLGHEKKALVQPASRRESTVTELPEKQDWIPELSTDRKSLQVCKASGCASRRSVLPGIIELPSTTEEATDQPDVVSQSPSLGSTPVSPVSRNSDRTQLDESEAVSPLESNFPLAHCEIIPQSTLTVPNLATRIVGQQSCVTPASQDSLSISNLDAAWTPYNLFETDSRYERVGLPCTMLAGVQGRFPTNQFDQDRPWSIFSTDQYQFNLDGELALGTLQSHLIQNEGLNPCPPLKPFAPPEELLLSEIVNTSWTTNPTYQQGQGFAPVEDVTTEVDANQAMSSFSSTAVDAQKNLYYDNITYPETLVTTEINLPRYSSFTGTEMSSVFDSSPTSLNPPALSPASTMTLMDSPYALNTFPPCPEIDDPVSPMFKTYSQDAGNLWRRSSDYELGYPQEIVSAMVKIQGVVQALPPYFKDSVPHPPESQADTPAPAASKVNCRKRKNDLSV